MAASIDATRLAATPESGLSRLVPWRRVNVFSGCCGAPRTAKTQIHTRIWVWGAFGRSVYATDIVSLLTTLVLPSSPESGLHGAVRWEASGGGFEQRWRSLIARSASQALWSRRELRVG